MCSTLTTRPKIKTGNPSHNQSPKILHFITTYKLYQIYTQFTKIIKMSSNLVRANPYISTQNKFSDNSKSPISPQNTYLQPRNPLQTLHIIEVPSKWYHYTINIIYTQFQIIYSILILQYPKFPCHIYIKRSNHFLLKCIITLPSQPKLSTKTLLSKSQISIHQKIPI